MLLQSTITCPHCGLPKTETMPTDACQFFYECTGCGAKLKPKSGDCCVFLRLGAVSPDSAQRAGEPVATTCCPQSAIGRQRVAEDKSVASRSLKWRCGSYGFA